MHNSDFDAHSSLCASSTLPAHRRVFAGRTHDRMWSPGESAMITRYSGPRVNGWDVAGWLLSGALLGLVAWMVWG